MSVGSQQSRTRKLVILAMMVALAVVLSVLKTPPLFAGGFLQYDASGAIVLLAALLYGPGEGILVALLTAAIRLLFPEGGGWVGVLMDAIAYLSLVIPAGWLFQRLRKRNGLNLIALVAGILSMVAVMIVANIILTPPLWGIPRPQVIAWIVPAFLPFNLLKAGANSVLAFILFQALDRLVFSRS